MIEVSINITANIYAIRHYVIRYCHLLITLEQRLLKTPNAVRSSCEICQMKLSKWIFQGEHGNLTANILREYRLQRIW